MIPMLVLLPGMDGTGELFAPLIAELGADIETLVVRYPNRAMDYAEHEAIARAALPDRPFVLLGESFSGPVAISIAATAPSGLQGLILSASFARCPLRFIQLFGPALASLALPPPPAFLTQPYLMGRFATPALRAAYRGSLRQASARTLAARLRAIARVDVSQNMRQVAVPTLYLRAREDSVVPAGTGDALLTMAQQGRLVDIEAPHMLLQGNPVAAAQSILDFLSDVSV